MPYLDLIERLPTRFGTWWSLRRDPSLPFDHEEIDVTATSFNRASTVLQGQDTTGRKPRDDLRSWNYLSDRSLNRKTSIERMWIPTWSPGSTQVDGPDTKSNRRRRGARMLNFSTHSHARQRNRCSQSRFSIVTYFRDFHQFLKDISSDRMT